MKWDSCDITEQILSVSVMQVKSVRIEQTSTAYIYGFLNANKWQLDLDFKWIRSGEMLSVIVQYWILSI